MSPPGLFDDLVPRPALTRDEKRQQGLELRGRLLAAQQRLRGADFPVFVLFAGVDGGGKTEAARTLCAWMDPRWIRTRAYEEHTDDERERPTHWRFWRDLVRRGRIGLYLSAWYSEPLLRRVHGRSDDAQLERALERIVTLERMLTADGALILKFWMHLGRDEQRTLFEALERDPLERWRVTERDWEHWRLYDRFERTSEAIIRRTDEPAPWHLVEASDPARRRLDVARVLAERLERRLDEPAPAQQDPSPRAGKKASPVSRTGSPSPALAAVDLTLALEKPEYSRRLAELQGRLARLQRAARTAGLATVRVFEGWDSAGKGGVIRRLSAALDPRDHDVVQIAAPSDEELARHYLWRFWRHVPRRGRATTFDRSWYGRVLVERVEDLATEAEWGRAYDEINYFERDLVESGVVVQKFWLHISPGEQERRFDARRKLPHKRWKLTDEDWRNRERWGDYEVAVEEMIARTSTPSAPWHLVAAEDKRWARVDVLERTCQGLEDALANR